MESLKNVLNSDENLPVDHQMQIIIGNITVPTGSGTIPITRLDNGPQNSIALKRSMLKETIGDNLCLPLSIGRAWLKLYDTVSLAKWKEITKKNLPGMNATMMVIKHRKMPKSYYKHVNDSTTMKYRKNMALTLCTEANVS